MKLFCSFPLFEFRNGVFAWMVLRGNYSIAEYCRIDWPQRSDDEGTSHELYLGLGHDIWLTMIVICMCDVSKSDQKDPHSRQATGKPAAGGWWRERWYSADRSLCNEDSRSSLRGHNSKTVCGVRRCVCAEARLYTWNTRHQSLYKYISWAIWMCWSCLHLISDLVRGHFCTKPLEKKQTWAWFEFSFDPRKSSSHLAAIHTIFPSHLDGASGAVCRSAVSISWPWCLATLQRLGCNGPVDQTWLGSSWGAWRNERLINALRKKTPLGMMVI